MDRGKGCENLKSRIQSKSMYLGAETGLKRLHLQISCFHHQQRPNLPEQQRGWRRGLVEYNPLSRRRVSCRSKVERCIS